MAELFSLGRTVATPGALEALERLGIRPQSLLDRHISGDWGELEPEDAMLNDEAVELGDGRVFSSYLVGSEENKVKVWVITEADRSSTCVLLPSEY